MEATFACCLSAYACAGLCSSKTLNKQHVTQPPRESSAGHTVSIALRAQVTVVCRRIGGAFGGKSSRAMPVAAAAAVAASKLRRRVRLVLNRNTDMRQNAGEAPAGRVANRLCPAGQVTVRQCRDDSECTKEFSASQGQQWCQAKVHMAAFCNLVVYLTPHRIFECHVLKLRACGRSHRRLSSSNALCKEQGRTVVGGSQLMLQPQG